MPVDGIMQREHFLPDSFFEAFVETGMMMEEHQREGDGGMEIAESWRLDETTSNDRYSVHGWPNMYGIPFHTFCMDTRRPTRFICIGVFFLIILAGTAGCTGTLPSSPAVPASSFTQDSVSMCNQHVVDSRIPVPANISVAIRDPMPGIKYSLYENDSGRTIVLEKGDIFEINLRWIPSLDLYWIIPVSGCGLELVNAGTYSDGTDFWNQSGKYRARFQAVTSGTSFLDGTFGGNPGGMAKGMPVFNLTVIVK